MVSLLYGRYRALGCTHAALGHRKEHMEGIRYYMSMCVYSCICSNFDSKTSTVPSIWSMGTCTCECMAAPTQEDNNDQDVVGDDGDVCALCCTKSDPEKMSMCDKC